MKSRLILLVIAISGLVSCSKEFGDVPQESEKIVLPAADAAVTESIQGILEYYPQDVQSVQAWLGHEYMVGETPIRPTKSVPSERLRKMVGLIVKIEGVWNSGVKSNPAKLTDDEVYLQTPMFHDGEIVIRGSGIEALSVLEVDK